MSLKGFDVLYWGIQMPEMKNENGHVVFDMSLFEQAEKQQTFLIATHKSSIVTNAFSSSSTKKEVCPKASLISQASFSLEAETSHSSKGEIWSVKNFLSAVPQKVIQERISHKAVPHKAPSVQPSLRTEKTVSVKPVVMPVSSPSSQTLEAPLPEKMDQVSVKNELIQQQSVKNRNPKHSAVKKNKKSDFSLLFSRISSAFQVVRLPIQAKKLLFNGMQEIKVLVGLFLGVFVLFYFFTNAQLVFAVVQDTLMTGKTEDMHQFSETLTHNAASSLKIEGVSELDQKIAQLDLEGTEAIARTMQEFLDKKGMEHQLNFNVLPPTNRLIIPDLNINVPLIDTEANGRVDFADETFDDELTKGVVKYPTTPDPGEKGNSLLFGHTSTEWWKKNDYGVVFRNIPKLQAGQRFQVLWNGQLYTYEMVERKVVLPKNVEEYYHVFAEKEESYITLMGCYPIGTADKRMMVVAKLIDTK